MVEGVHAISQYFAREPVGCRVFGVVGKMMVPGACNYIFVSSDNSPPLPRAARIDTGPMAIIFWEAID